ncbi:DUF4407 domain-containing protein (plasmid) [Rhodococcus opacus]|uniref:DUF4407 domain-containing protein n=1 Tax=Rhodococcus opacus TaxID=37919 RepID=UPI0011C3EF25|nr:DUF4407 domain-containing protein [Rhodococcus opacus]QZS52668.1 DUF4407 domain-containing protein [Rhodococcus opacus]
MISTPLMLKIFESEIEAQLNRNILTAQEQLRTEINGSTASADLSDAEQKAGELRALINAGPTADPAAHPQVQAVQAEIDALQKTGDKQKSEYDTARALALAEEEGTDGTGIAGCAAICVEKKRLADEAMARWQQTVTAVDGKRQEKDRVAQTLQGNLLDASQRRIDDAEQELPIVEQKVTQLREQIASSQDTSYQLEQANGGIIARMKALSDLVGSDATVAMARYTVWAMFIALELLPVIFKVLAGFGTPTKYDEVLDELESAEAAAATADIGAMKKRHELRDDAEMAAEKDRIDKHQHTILKINDAVVEHQTEVIEAALARWRDHAKIAAEDQLDSWAASLATTATPPVLIGSAGASVASSIPAPGHRPGTPHGNSHGGSPGSAPTTRHAGTPGPATTSGNGPTTATGTAHRPGTGYASGPLTSDLGPRTSTTYGLPDPTDV